MFKNIPMRHLIPLLLLSSALVFVIFFYAVSLPAAKKQAERHSQQQTRAVLQVQHGRFADLLLLQENSQLNKEIYYVSTDPNTYRVLILDETNTVKYSSRSRYIGKNINDLGLPVQEDLIEQASKERRILLGQPSANSPYIAGYAALQFTRDNKDYRWRLIIIRDYKRITDAILEIATYPSEMLATFLLLVSVTAIIVLRSHLERRTLPLLQTASRISRGEKNVRTAIEGTDEFADIAASLDQMASRIDAQRLELENAKLNAEKANAAKNYFLHHMSHEIQTPLTALLGFIDLIKETGLNTEASLYLRTMETSASTLSDLINDLLETSRLEAGTVTPVPQAFCLNTNIQSLLDTLLPRARDKGLSLKITCSDDEPIWLDSDPRIFRQILVNLIGNAIQYTEKGTINISIEPVAVADDETDLTITVSDTGIGISEKDIPRIFNRFFRSNAPNVRRQKGAGIGLTTCMSFAKLINGSLDVESTLGVGSSFTFRVLVPSSIPEREYDFSALSMQQQESLLILLVEHTPVSQLLLKSILEKTGHRVETCRTAEAAIQFMKRRLIYPHLEQASLVLMDLHMPEVDGFRAAEEIRGLDSRYERTPIIATSTQNDQVMRDKVAAEEFDGFIAKPIDRRILAEEIFRVTRQLGAKKDVVSEELRDSEPIAEPAQSVN
ncbi:MAG: response regulator [Kordiimonadaceae bacterium]|nr:response regulator [Kordiimonadaceae bacterium]